MELQSGKGKCDRCGRHTPNTGPTYMVSVLGMDQSGEPLRFHLCTTKPDPCAPRVLTRAALATRLRSGEPPRFYQDREDHPKP